MYSTFFTPLSQIDVPAEFGGFDCAPSGAQSVWFSSVLFVAERPAPSVIDPYASKRLSWIRGSDPNTGQRATRYNRK
jgi:hypothetical protein